MKQIKSKVRKRKETIKNRAKLAQHWWLMPVILATQEAEIRRITI
jgi:hypothetical protein